MRRQQIIVSYPPTKQLSSEEQDLVWKFRYYLTTQEKVVLSFLNCSSFWTCTLVQFLGPFGCCLHTFSPTPPPPTPGSDKVPEMRELGSASGGQTSSGAAGEVEAHGCGGLAGAALLPFHQPNSEALRCGSSAAGRR